MLKETWLGNVRNLPRDAVVIEVTRSKKHVLSPSWKMLNEDIRRSRHSDTAGIAHDDRRIILLFV